jgi:AraC-like DNA-binding protein
MKRVDLARPSVPVAYVQLTLEQAHDRGISREALVDGTDIERILRDEPNGYVAFGDYGLVVHRLLERTGDGGLGYDFGLRANLSVHGVPGFGMMNSSTLREAAAFGVGYFARLRTPGFAYGCFIDGDQAVIDVREAVSFGRLRRYAFDLVLCAMTHIARQFVPLSEMELWFDCPEPDYFGRYKDRLPCVKFDAGANQLRCPVNRLERRLETASPLSKRLVEQQCERELALLGNREPLLARVRAALTETGDGYPDLQAVASRLGLSSRTLKRHLREHGFSFRRLLEEVRCRDGIRLLKESRLSVENIAFQLGYTAPGNFTRAFRSWTGTTPAAFRRSHRPLGVAHASP